jgi:2-desacetyl-2-hydroxyethyl bacteriochlorophyllide A dehydrogenase
MRAIQLVAFGIPGRFELRDLPDPEPRPDEVVIEVRACGLNRLDLWVEENALPIKPQLPRTPGGELAGRVVEVGRDAAEWSIGTRVAVQSNFFCASCEYCLRGEESMCLQGYPIGVLRDGGFAEKVAVPARSLVRIADSVSYEGAAALTLAGSTAMHMLTDRASVKRGDTVLVMGASSGVGSSAIQIARALGAEVIATGSTEAKRELGRRLGAHHVVDSTNKEWPKEVRALTDRRGVDWIVEHIGGEVLEQALCCLARGGTIVTCGATGGRDATFNLWSFFVKQQRLIGSYARNRTDLLATLDWAAEGKLKPVIDAVFPLAQCADAYAKLRSRQVLGKILVAPTT